MLIIVFAFTGVSVADNGSLTVMAQWGGQELDAFMKVIERFEEKTGIDVKYESTRDTSTVLVTRIQAGNPPEVCVIPDLGLIKDLGQEGSLVDLNKVLDMDRIKEEYNDVWLDLTTVDGHMYGLVMTADIKSLIWYNPKAFKARGYEVPGTLDELMSLTERMARKGDIPWAVGLESGPASGWPGTDWIEDLVLRLAGPEVFDKWINHEIPWTDPRIKEAFEYFGKIVKNSKYVWGGPTSVLMTNFGDAVAPLYTEPPQAFMHKQASFITSFILEHNPDLVAGEDYDFFPFPPAEKGEGVPVLGAADMVSMLKDTPEARKFVDFLSTPEAQTIFIKELGKIGVNKTIDLAVYPDKITRKMARTLLNASVFRFDGSNSMPAAVGSGAFNPGILDYVRGKDLDDVLKSIEAVAEENY
ncbi:ABC transporter substrate-binding protein [Halothermothrix orenii]|uniref:ABC transporter substrate-binding protein n=1 Tax=Halothermothrix orenii TaxID=31909 RepID=UPI001D05BC7D|nr:ABC transporter substrate-binding protein [Halothermothrix orenii]